MFRTFSNLALLLALASGAHASGACTAPCGADAPDGDRPAAHLHDDYLRFQLDWRSYYLQRMTTMRSETPQGTAVWRQLPGPSGN